MKRRQKASSSSFEPMWSSPPTMTSQPFRRSPASCHSGAAHLTMRASGLIGADHASRRSRSSPDRPSRPPSVPPTSRLRLVKVMMSSSRSTKPPIPRWASCWTTCELPPPRPTRPMVAAANRASLFGAKETLSIKPGHGSPTRSAKARRCVGTGRWQPAADRPPSQRRPCAASLLSTSKAVRHPRRGLEEARHEVLGAVQVHPAEPRLAVTAVGVDVQAMSPPADRPTAPPCASPPSRSWPRPGGRSHSPRPPLGCSRGPSEEQAIAEVSGAGGEEADPFMGERHAGDAQVLPDVVQQPAVDLEGERSLQRPQMSAQDLVPG